VKLLYTATNSLLVSHLRNILEGDGIACRMKNEFLYSGAGEIPPTEIWPEIWVEEEVFGRAKQLLDDFLSDRTDEPKWQCRRCGEEIEGQFAVCWNCGGPHEEE